MPGGAREALLELALEVDRALAEKERERGAGQGGGGASVAFAAAPNAASTSSSCSSFAPPRRVVAADLVRARNVYGFHASEELFVKLSFAHPYDVKRAAAAFAEGRVRAAAVAGGGEKKSGGEEAENDGNGNADDGDDKPSRSPLRVACFEAHIPFVLQFKADCGLAGMDVAEFERGRVRGGWPLSGPRRKWWQQRAEEKEEEEKDEEEKEKEEEKRVPSSSSRSLVWTSGSPYAAAWELPWPSGCKGARGGKGPARVSKEGLGRGESGGGEEQDKNKTYFSSSSSSSLSVIEVDVTADAVANAKAESARRVPLEAMPGLFDDEDDQEGSAFPSSLSFLPTRPSSSSSPPLPPPLPLPRRRAVASLRPMWRDEAARCPGGKLPPPPRDVERVPVPLKSAAAEELRAALFEIAEREKAAVVPSASPPSASLPALTQAANDLTPGRRWSDDDEGEQGGSAPAAVGTLPAATGVFASLGDNGEENENGNDGNDVDAETLLEALAEAAAEGPPLRPPPPAAALFPPPVSCSQQAAEEAAREAARAAAEAEREWEDIRLSSQALALSSLPAAGEGGGAPTPAAAAARRSLEPSLLQQQAANATTTALPNDPSLEARLYEAVEEMASQGRKDEEVGRGEEVGGKGEREPAAATAAATATAMEEEEKKPKRKRLSLSAAARSALMEVDGDEEEEESEEESEEEEEEEKEEEAKETSTALATGAALPPPPPPLRPPSPSGLPLSFPGPGFTLRPRIPPPPPPSSLFAIVAAPAREPFYSDAADAPARPPVYAGVERRLPAGKCGAGLPPWSEDETRRAAQAAERRRQGEILADVQRRHPRPQRRKSSGEGREINPFPFLLSPAAWPPTRAATDAWLAAVDGKKAVAAAAGGGAGSGSGNGAAAPVPSVLHTPTTMMAPAAAAAPPPRATTTTAAATQHRGSNLKRPSRLSQASGVVAAPAAAVAAAAAPLSLPPTEQEDREGEEEQPLFRPASPKYDEGGYFHCTPQQQQLEAQQPEQLATMTAAAVKGNAATTTTTQASLPPPAKRAAVANAASAAAKATANAPAPPLRTPQSGSGDGDGPSPLGFARGGGGDEATTAAGAGATASSSASLSLLSVEVVASTSAPHLLPDPRRDALRAIVLSASDDDGGPPPRSWAYPVRALVVVEAGNGAAGNEGNGEGKRKKPNNKSTTRGLLPASELSTSTVLPFPDEKALLLGFLEQVKLADPDVLLGWDPQGGSLGYLSERGAAVGVEVDAALLRVAVAVAPAAAPQNPNSSSAPAAHAPASVPLSFSRSASASASALAAASAAVAEALASPAGAAGGRLFLSAWRLARQELRISSHTQEACCAAVLRVRVPFIPQQQLAAWWDGDDDEKKKSGNENENRKDDRWRALAAVSRRARLSLALLDSLDVLGRASEMARTYGIDVASVLTRGSQYRVEAMLLRLAHASNYLLRAPSRNDVEAQPAMEAVPLVAEPETGFQSCPVAVLDFQSLYPSMVIAYNLCFSTLLGRAAHAEAGSGGSGGEGNGNGNERPLRLGVDPGFSLPAGTLAGALSPEKLVYAPNGVAFAPASARPGVLPRLLKEVLDTRVMVKGAMARCERRSADNNLTKGQRRALLRSLNARQFGLKLIANVTYGYAAAGFSGRMPCAELADAIVQVREEKKFYQSFHF